MSEEMHTLRSMCCGSSVSQHPVMGAPWRACPTSAALGALYQSAGVLYYELPLTSEGTVAHGLIRSFTWQL